MELFERFEDLVKLDWQKATKKYQAELEKSAIAWYEKQFKAQFRRTEEYPKWYYSGGVLIFKVSTGMAYHYRFIVEMAHFEFWQLPPWKEAVAHVRKHKKSRSDNYHRDNNPYPKENFYYNQAWDAGFIMALEGFSFKKLLSGL